MTDVFYVGNDPPLTYGYIYQLRSLLHTPYGPMARLAENGHAVALVPLRDVVDVTTVEDCPQCGGRGCIEWERTIAVQNPNDPYGEPIPWPEQCIEPCDMCGGRGRMLESPYLIHSD